jgi:hypothetical protein
MTSEQSFAGRLGQHMAFQTGFSNIMRETGLSWLDLEFHCLSLDGLLNNEVKAIEKLIQAVLRPPYCRG